MTRLRALVLAGIVASACTQPVTLSHFDSDGVTFDYPSTWNAATFDMPSSFNHWWVWLSTEAMQDPCIRTSNSEETSIDCNGSPVVGTLRPNGLLADWSSNGFPDWSFDPNAGTGIKVDGIQGTIEVLAADMDCVGIGAKTRVRVIVPAEVAHNWTQLDVCINGPFDGAVKEQVMAMIASADVR
jgi:hypothetical protein